MTPLEKYHEYLDFWKSMVPKGHMTAYKITARKQLLLLRQTCQHENIVAYGHNCKLCGAALFIGTNIEDTTSIRAKKRAVHQEPAAYGI